jgi:hypothetical protein
MGPSVNPLTCARCHNQNPPGANYCQRCGEPVSPDILRDLQRLYDTLKELDAAVGRGAGQTTVSEFRETLLQRYLAMRTPQPPVSQPDAGAAPVAEEPAAAPRDASSPVFPPITPAITSPAITSPAITSPVAHGPVFTWRAFIADQAIAIMAYLGGFLLLIATLTFEVGGWSALPDLAKLAGVTLVYVVFGILGIGLRRVAMLRTVSRVYLGVFALMTPLQALAVYRFELQAQGFSQSGMVCLAAAYAAVIYVALAARTRFATYAYLGWAAALISAIAIPAWAQTSDGWWLTAMTLAALALLIPHWLGLRRPNSAIAWLAPPAMWISAPASCVAALFAPALLLNEFGALSLRPPMITEVDTGPKLALAVTLGALMALSLVWHWALRTLGNPVRWEALSVTAWLVAAFAASASAALALALGANASLLAYTLAATGLLEGLIALALRSPLSRLAGVLPSVKVLTIAVAVLSVLFGAFHVAPNYPLITACAVGLALGLMYALSGQLSRVVAWGVTGGLFALLGAFPVFAATTPLWLLYATDDAPTSALFQLPSLYAGAVMGLVVVGLALHFIAPPASRLRRLRVAAQIVALIGSFIGALTLIGHSGRYDAVIMGMFAMLAFIVGWIERRPLPPGVVTAFYGSIAAVIFISVTPNALVVAAVAPAVALIALVIYSVAGRAYALPAYVVSLLSVLAAFLRLSQPLAGLPEALLRFALGPGGIVALIVAGLMAVAALRERNALWQIAPASVALISVFAASDLWPLVVITLGLAGTGALSRWRRGPGWGTAWHGAALLASISAIQYTLTGAYGGPDRAVEISLSFLIVAWLVAWQEQRPWLTVASVPYALVAFHEIGALPLDLTGRLAMTVALTLAFAGVGALARARIGRPWALALYCVAVMGTLFTIQRITSYPERAGLLEAALLLYAAVAFAVVLLEESSWAAVAPAMYAVGAVAAQPDGRALLPLALGLAVAAYTVSRIRGAQWALPLYAAAMVAAMASSWQSQAIPTFEPVALATLAVSAWLLAALESRPDAIVIALTFAALAVPATGYALNWQEWQTGLAFVALAWLASLSGLVWARVPWLRERSGVWLDIFARSSEAQAEWRDPRIAGERVSRAMALVISAGAVVGGALAPGAFATHAEMTQVVAIALLSLTGLLIFEGVRAEWRAALYLAGEIAALFVTWELRWLGAHNLQAWIIAPGSAQIIIGAMLPADRRLRAPKWLGQAFSVAGALILTLPTLAQSVTEPAPWQWIYALTLAVESLTLTLLAVGLRNRLLALTGSAFVGVAAIRGAIIALNQNLPAPLVIGVFALALMGLATWLSLRARLSGGVEDGGRV